MKKLLEIPLNRAKSLQSITVPAGAEFLSVGEQKGELLLWAVADPEAPTVDQVFRIHGTGQFTVDDPGKFVGTVQFEHGFPTLHVFAVPT